MSKVGDQGRRAIEGTRGSEATAAGLRSLGGVTVTATETVEEANRQAAGRADVVVLAVSPQLVPDVAEESAGSLGFGQGLTDALGGGVDGGLGEGGGGRRVAGGGGVEQAALILQE